MDKIAAATLGMVGFALFGFTVNWLAAIGIMLMFIGNNLDRSGRR